MAESARAVSFRRSLFIVLDRRVNVVSLSTQGLTLRGDGLQLTIDVIEALLKVFTNPVQSMLAKLRIAHRTSGV